MISTIETVFEEILDYLAPVAELLLDPDVSEIMINPNLRVFEERRGKKSEIRNVKLDRKNVDAIARRIARSNDEELSDTHDIIKARLHDGSRVTIVGPPATPAIAMTVRKFQHHFFTVEELIACGTLAPELWSLLQRIIDNRQTLLLSGGTSSGKTTFLNSLVRFIPDDQRIVLIEKPSEIQIDHPNVFPMEASKVNSMRELVQASMRLSPDRIIVGEVAGEEALDMLQAMNSGHEGSFSTIHANSAAQALSKLTNYALRGWSEKSTVVYLPLRREIADCIHYVVQLKRMRDGSRVATELIKIHGYNVDKDEFRTETLFSVDSDERGETKQQ
jgi:pilus assembly protein CpaF